MQTKILIVDDHPIVRDGLRTHIQTQPDLHIVGETGNGLEVVPLVMMLKPDVLLLDLALKGLDGIEVTRRVRKQAPHTRIVILSMYDNEAYVTEALKSGAHAYVLKKCVSIELLNAIRAVLDGEYYLSPPLSVEKINIYDRELQTTDLNKIKTLTPREREVLHSVVEGLTSQEIAQRLVIGVRTVEMHRANIMSKLGARSAVDLVSFAIKQGIQLPE